MDTKEVVRRVQTGVRAFETRYLNKRLEWLQPFQIDLRLELAYTSQRSNWPGLLRVAKKHRRVASRDLTAMAAQQKEWERLWRDVERLRVVAEKSWRPLAQRAEWPTLRQEIFAGLRSKGLTTEQARKSVAFLGRATAGDMLKRIDIDRSAQELEVGAISRFSAMAAADMADAVARFNTAYEAGRRRKPAKGAVMKASAEITTLLRNLRVALHSGRRNVVIARARRAERRTVQLLGPMLETAAYWGLRIADENNAGENNAESRRRAVEVADAIRKALFASSAARVVRWNAGWPEGSSFLKSWSEAAKAKPFETAFRAPPVTALSRIIRRPQAFDGKYLAVEGRVGPVTILHRGRKVISSTSLSDATGAVLQVGLTHIKLDSGGMVPGTSAHITGTFTTKHDDFPAPVFVPDRRNLTEDSQQSWLDWLSLQLLPVVTPTPHMLCARWSWSAGINGATNPLRYGTWASNPRR